MARDRKDRKERKARREKRSQEKPPIGQRIGKNFGDRARALGELGDDIVKRPKVLPGKAHGWFRLWFGKVWRVRGGGLYALGFAVTFAILEIRTFIEDLAGGLGLGGLFSGNLDGVIEFFLDFLLDSLMNTVSAFMWPVYVVQFAPPFGMIGLVLGFVFFASVLKKPIEKWLFGDEGISDLPAEAPDDTADHP